MITSDKDRAKAFIDKLDGLIEIRLAKKTRSSQQNRALHLFFRMVADELNEMGLEFTYTGVKGMSMSVPYTEQIVKDFIWRPIQKALFNIESTTKLTTEQIDRILDVIIKFFAESGAEIHFPSSFDIYLNLCYNE